MGYLYLKGNLRTNTSTYFFVNDAFVGSEAG